MSSFWHGTGTVQRLLQLYHHGGAGKTCLNGQWEKDIEKLQQCKSLKIRIDKGDLNSVSLYNCKELVARKSH